MSTGLCVLVQLLTKVPCTYVYVLSLDEDSSTSLMLCVVDLLH